jgi:enamine deaminase RidA (YjgF/YER057c/UK114 family)
MVLIAAVTWAPNLVQAAEVVRCIDPDESTGSAAAVIVEDVPLLYTTQFTDSEYDDPRRQTELVLDRIDDALARSEQGFANLVKLNVCVARTADADVVRDVLSKRFRDRAKPAVSYVVGKTVSPPAKVAIDAVGACSSRRIDDDVRRVNVQLPGRPNEAHVARLPAGPKIFVSGQAEKGSDMAEATRLTLESLRKTLEFLGLSLHHVVQVKAFLGPMSSQPEAQKAIVEFFGADKSPPTAWVEWSSSLPIEIELVAAGRPDKHKPSGGIEYLTPPGMQASPVFSRVAIAGSGKLIFVSGLYGSSRDNGAAEVQEVFASLGTILEKSGSDMRHLAKATYYVAADDASAKLNELRPKFYDPQRPPAASKAQVSGTGLPGRTLTLDMIAVPAPR